MTAVAPLANKATNPTLARMATARMSDLGEEVEKEMSQGKTSKTSE